MTNPIYTPAAPAVTPTAVLLTRAEADVVEQLRSLRYGTLEVQVHDTRIVQLERRERHRFDARLDR